MRIIPLILAAGTSSRMGKAKQLLPWGDTTLLGNAIQVVRKSGLSPLIVLGAEANKIRSAISIPDSEVVINQNWKQGLGSSISVGIKQLLLQEPLPDAVMILLADQPFVDSAYLDILIRHYKSGHGQIICSSYKEKPGVPAIFDRQFFSELSTLDGDRGASGIMKRNEKVCLRVEAGNRLMDLDTPEDYSKFKSNTRK